jgi:hypothetical protein
MMNRKTIVVITLCVAGLLVGGALLFRGTGERPAVTVTLRIAVTPPEQSAFVAGQANSSRFKYLISKQAGVNPVFAQRFHAKPVPNSSLLEGRVGVSTKEEAERYVAGFIETLQLVCGTQAQVALADKTIH